MELSLYERMRNKLIKTADNFKEKIENVMYMGSFDDDYEVKTKTRMGNVGTDLPTLLALLDSDDF